MSGGGSPGVTGSAIQAGGYPAASPGIAAGAAPQAQSVSQLQALLQKMAQPGPGGMKSPALQVGGLGQQLMQQGQQPPPQMMARPQMMGQRPMGGPPVTSTPQMAGAQGTMNGGMGLNPSQLNMLLARQNGLMQ